MLSWILLVFLSLIPLNSHELTKTEFLLTLSSRQVLNISSRGLLVDLAPIFKPTLQNCMEDSVGNY